MYIKILLLALGLVILVVAQLAAAQGLPPMTPYNTLYTAIITSAPVLSNDSYNVNVFGAGYHQYGIVFAYLALYNVSSGGWIPDLAQNWTIQWITSGPLFGWTNITIYLRKSGWSNGQPYTCWDIWAQNMIQSLFYEAMGNVTIYNNYTCSILVPHLSFLVKDSKLFTLRIVSNRGLGMFINYQTWKPLVDNLSKYWNLLYAVNFDRGTMEEMQEGDALIYQQFQYFKTYKPNVPFPPPQSGPFYVCKVTPSEYVLCKNPYYWAADKIKIDYIVVYQFGSTAQLISALKTGQLSIYVGNFSPSIAATILQNPNNHYALLTGTPGYGLYFNWLYPYINDTRVRQAIFYAINIPAAVDAAGPPYAPPNPYNLLIWPTVNPDAYKIMMSYLQSSGLPLNNYTYNPNKATQLLTAAGFKKQGGIWYTPNGTPFTLTIYIGSGDAADPQKVAMLSTIASQLTSFGIQTSLYVFPDSSWPGVVSQNSTKYAMLGRYSVPDINDFEIIVPNISPAAEYFEYRLINVTHWNGVMALPVDITLPNGTKIPAGTAVRLFERGSIERSSIQDICIRAAGDPIRASYFVISGFFVNWIKCESLFSWFNNINPWVVLLITPRIMVWYNDQYLQFPPNSSWVWKQTPVILQGAPFWWSIVTNVSPKPATTTTTTTTPTTTTTVVSSTTVTTSTTPTTTIPVTTTVSAMPSWVWALVALLIIVIIIVAVLALRRR